MADQTFMFMIAAATMIGLAVLLFVSKRLRVRSSRSIEKERHPPSAAPSDPAHHNKKGHDNKSGKVKKYTSDGKPVYED
jgi:hypothetical protein